MGSDADYSFALWIPPEVGGEWTATGDYVAPTEFQFGTVTLMQQTANSGTSTTSYFLPMLVLGAVIALWQTCQ